MAEGPVYTLLMLLRDSAMELIGDKEIPRTDVLDFLTSFIRCEEDPTHSDAEEMKGNPQTARSLLKNMIRAQKVTELLELFEHKMESHQHISAPLWKYETIPHDVSKLLTSLYAQKTDKTIPAQVEALSIDSLYSLMGQLVRGKWNDLLDFMKFDGRL